LREVPDNAPDVESLDGCHADVCVPILFTLLELNGNGLIALEGRGKIDRRIHFIFCQPVAERCACNRARNRS
jgi:hypothetical protein